MKEISALDASILALLAQVPKGVESHRKDLFEQTQKGLLERLTPGAAREIGEAVLAEDESAASFSPAARVTAGEMKRWAQANGARPQKRGLSQ